MDPSALGTLYQKAADGKTQFVYFSLTFPKWAVCRGEATGSRVHGWMGWGPPLLQRGCLRLFCSSLIPQGKAVLPRTPPRPLVLGVSSLALVSLGGRLP